MLRAEPRSHTCLPACLLLLLLLLQRVQQQLTSSEKQDKQDDSPVTVADYGAALAAASFTVQVGSA